MRSQGRVIKGKKLPGHMGADLQVMKNLKLLQLIQMQTLCWLKDQFLVKLVH